MKEPEKRVGVGHGHSTLFKKANDLPRLKQALVEQACAQIKEGNAAYRSVLYLCFARVHDIDTLFLASQSEDVEVRWHRLWVLAPFLTKLSRSQAGREVIERHLRDDLQALSLLSKFEEQRHPSVRRLFSRMHDPLLAIVLDALCSSPVGERRFVVLAKILASIETERSVLKNALQTRVGDPEAVLVHLHVKAHASQKVDTEALRKKLLQLGHAFAATEGEDQ